MENQEIVKPYLTNTDIGIVLSEQQGIEIAEKARQDEKQRLIIMLKEKMPYSTTTFIEPTPEEQDELYKAMDSIRQKRGLHADGVAGSLMREGWYNAVRCIESEDK